MEPRHPFETLFGNIRWTGRRRTDGNCWRTMKDDNQLFKQFMDNDGFKRWMTDTVFELTSEQASAA